MTREELKKIIEGITDEQLKAILDINSSDIGKAKADFESLKAENNILKADKGTLTRKITELTEKSDSADDYKKQLEELKAELAAKEEADEKAKEDAELTDSIAAVFGDREFTSDYVRRGIIADMKTEIAKPENKGKGYADLFEALTKDKEGIFANPNPPGNMAPMGNLSAGIASENQARAVMGLPPVK